jgi:SAM-dependent methyltransferase
MLSEDLQKANERARHAWNHNAAFWDDRMGEGNDFVEVLIWPATERLLDLQRDERVLDIACGNGLSSRRLAAQGARVVAFDFAENMIDHALARTPKHEDRIQYLVLDATDQEGLLALIRWPNCCGLGDASFSRCYTRASTIRTQYTWLRWRIGRAGLIPATPSRCWDTSPLA